MKITFFAFTVLLACACTVSYADESIDFLRIGTSADHFTQVLAGIASNVAGQVDISSIIGCGSEAAFQSIETALSPIIAEAATCDPTKIDDIANKVSAIVAEIPADQQQCLNQNAEAQKLLSELGILGLTPTQIKSKVASYVFGHILSICSTLDSLNQKYKGGDFTGFGTDAGKLVIAIFKSSSERTIAEDIVFALMVSDKLNFKALDGLAALFTGMASVTPAKGADFSASVKCTDEATASNILSTTTDMINQGATCDLSKAAEIAKKVKALVDSIPANHKQCFNADPALKQLGLGLGVDGKQLDSLVTKALAYAIGHFSEICTAVQGLNGDAKSGNWNQFGTDAGKLVLKILA